MGRTGCFHKAKSFASFIPREEVENFSRSGDYFFATAVKEKQESEIFKETKQLCLGEKHGQLLL